MSNLNSTPYDVPIKDNRAMLVGLKIYGATEHSESDIMLALIDDDTLTALARYNAIMQNISKGNADIFELVVYNPICVVPSCDGVDMDDCTIDNVWDNGPMIVWRVTDEEWRRIAQAQKYNIIRPTGWRLHICKERMYLSTSDRYSLETFTSDGFDMDFLNQVE